jgi:ATP-dependent helicase/nuclease subunit A
MSILDSLQLNDPQIQAATTPGNVIVTAGAGSGKTRTLVGRYLWHLEAGAPLRAVVAITFTEKAAREMRTRIRQTITDWLAQAPPRRAFWEAAFADLDAARIGTIHSLCAQILRDHPVEAARLGVSPGFGVLEEGHAAVFRARAVEDALAWAAENETTSYLFRSLKEFGLRTVVSTLVEKRLDADPAFERLSDDPLQGWTHALLGWLDGHLDATEWRSILDDLTGLQADDLADGASVDKMEIARQEVLAHAEAADAARQRGDVSATLAALAALRQSTTLSGRKGSWPGDTLETAKASMRALRAYFDERLAPLADPKKTSSWRLDEQVAGLMWLLHAVYRRALEFYSRARQAENALDFDDLEAKALALLQAPGVRAVWQENVHAVLVDEFQDTNERQREIVYALSGFGASASRLGALFVVGDSKQSIYRFRGADVTVFRRVQDDVAQAGGEVITLDLTFRAHHVLVEETNRLLAPVLGAAERPGRPYEVPFAPLQAHRREPQSGIAAPFIEFHLGVGQVADEGRRAAADGLATRLLDLRAQGAVEWKDVALLFRASTAFPVYEDALERAGIPFVTVAGRGFYDRAEIRDLLNALVAVADPTDDLALVGFLRSPAVGLSDAALYLLRFPPPEAIPRADHKPCAVWPVLNHPALPDVVSPEELSRVLYGRDLVIELHDLAGRVSVAALLKRLLDQTHYNAALQTAPGGPRAQRNVDKLLSDAHASDLVSVTEFAEYVRALRDVGARESEAPTEAGSAVQLMTVHKAKGLEFPIVVIADAAHAGHGRSADVLLDDLLGVTVNLREKDRQGNDLRPLTHRLAALRNAERDDAENRRLLYVAATRAQEKLLVSGHTKILKGGGLSLAGWLELLGQAVGLDGVTVAGTPYASQALPLSGDVGCVLHPWREETAPHGSAPRVRETVGGYRASVVGDLVAPLVAPAPGDDPKLSARETDPPPRVWRVVPVSQRPEGPAWVVGSLVHVALRHWYFPDRPGWEEFLRPFALEAGLTDPQEIHRTIAEARRMLSRFQSHALYAELDRAERRPELPYTLEVDGAPKSGVVDLLARLDDGWTVVEFKTDELRAGADLAAHVREKKYDEQVQGYVAAVARLTGARPRAMLVFLNVGRQVEVVCLTHGENMVKFSD